MIYKCFYVINYLLIVGMRPPGASSSYDTFPLSYSSMASSTNPNAQELRDYQQMLSQTCNYIFLCILNATKVKT